MSITIINIKAALGRLTEWSLYGIVIALPLSKTAIEICATIAIVSWACMKLLSGKAGMRLARTDLNLPVLVFCLAAFLSILWSTNPALSLKAFLSKLAEYVLLYFIVVETCREKRMIRNMMVAMAAIALVICVDGAYQKITGHDFVRGYQLHSMERLTCSFQFPNGLSAWLLVAWFPFISMSFYYKSDARIRAACIVLTAFMAFVAYFGLTRAAFLSFAAALIFMFLLMGGRISWFAFAILILGVISAIFLLPAQIRNNIYLFKLMSGSSAEHRIKVWTAALRMFLDRPILGQGFNTFMANYERFRLPDDSGIWYAHNTYLQVAAELGVFGLLSFLWLVAGLVRTSLLSFRKIQDDFLRLVYVGFFCGVIAFLALSLFEVTHFSLQGAVLFYVALGILMAVKNIGLGEYGKV